MFGKHCQRDVFATLAKTILVLNELFNISIVSFLIFVTVGIYFLLKYH